jgi:predicted ArsR family transcriptional regulator
MDAFEAIGDPDLRAALLFARGHDRAVTADELAEAQGVHRNVARSRLERLVAAGLLAPAFERRSGRSGPGAGRPAKTYAVVPELAPIEFPSRRYDVLVGLLVEAVPARMRARKLEEVGAAFGRKLAEAAELRTARRRREGLERMCERLGGLGFQASLAELDGDHAVVSTPTCPLRPLVVAQPDAAALDHGMWGALAARAVGGGCEVTCKTHDCLHADAPCRIELSFSR